MPTVRTNERFFFLCNTKEEIVFLCNTKEGNQTNFRSLHNVSDEEQQQQQERWRSLIASLDQCPRAGPRAVSREVCPDVKGAQSMLRARTVPELDNNSNNKTAEAGGQHLRVADGILDCGGHTLESWKTSHEMELRGNDGVS